MKVGITDFENIVFTLDGIRIVIRYGIGAKVEEYPFKRKAPGTMSLKNFLAKRVLPFIGVKQVEVIDGYGNSMIHMSKKISEIRNSYMED